MKFSLKYVFSSLFGATAPTSPIVKNRARPLVEMLEDRLVPFGLGAQTFTVTTILDDNVAHVGFLSLRQAIDAANNNGNPGFVDTIQFAPGLAGKTIKLDSSLGELQIQESVLIDGLGANKLTVDGGAVGGEGGSRIFDIFGGEGSPIKVTVKGLTLANGHAIGGSDGGAILLNNGNNADSLTVKNDVFIKNSAIGGEGDGEGGAIKVATGNLMIQSSLFSANVAGGEGAAVQSDGSGNVTIQDSTFDKNVAGVEGAVMIDRAQSTLIERCTFSNNTGGGLWLNDGLNGDATVSQSSFFGNVSNTSETGAGAIGDESRHIVNIQNTTISGNSTSGDGGGIANFDGGGILNLRNVTISQNKALNGEGGGVYTTSRGTTNIINSIIEGNRDKTGANDISFGGSFGESTYNVKYSLIQAVPSGTINGINSHNIFHVSADLMPLGFYFGGTTKSQPPKQGSVAIKAGLYSLVSAFYSVDQNGRIRSSDHITVDLGAVESGLSRTRRGA